MNDHDPKDSAGAIDQTQRRYEKSDKGRSSRRKYIKSPKGKQALTKYSDSEKKKLSQQKYLSSKKGKETYKQHLEELSELRKAQKWIRSHPGSTFPDYQNWLDQQTPGSAASPVASPVDPKDPELSSSVI